MHRITDAGGAILAAEITGSEAEGSSGIDLQLPQAGDIDRLADDTEY